MKSKIATDGDWLVTWDPEDPAQWDKRLAWHTLTITTLLLLLPMLGWGFEVTNPDMPYWRLMGVGVPIGYGWGSVFGHWAGRVDYLYNPHVKP